jgi:hypothetical protein
MSLIDDHPLHISGGSFIQVAGHLNEYRIAGDLIQTQGENGEPRSGSQLFLRILTVRRNQPVAATNMWGRVS